MGRKSLYRRSKRGDVPRHRYDKERKHARPKNTARGYRDGRARRPLRVLKTGASHLNPSLLLDGINHDVVLGGLGGGRPPRRPMVVTVIDSFSRRVVGFFVAEGVTEEVPRNVPIILADSGPAYRSQDVGDLLGRLGVRLFSAGPIRPDYKAVVERYFSPLAERFLDASAPDDPPDRADLTEDEEEGWIH